MPHTGLGTATAARVFRRAALISAGFCLCALLLPTGTSPANAQLLQSLLGPGEYQVAHYTNKRRRYRRSVSRKSVEPPDWFVESDGKDPVHLVVSLPKQQMTVYQGDKVLTTSKVSSGKPGYSTPAGVFSILEQKRHHYSNIYRGAPMPFMQRLTWSGIALHASNSVPNRPASHGCVRLPPPFASQLFRVTQRGGHVVIANEEGVAPKEVDHPNLFQPEMIPPKDFDVEETERLARLNGIKIEEKERSTKPVRILVTRRTGRELFMEMQQMLNDLQFNAGDVDGWMGPDTSKAIRRFQATYGIEKTGTMSPELMDMLYEVSGKGKPLNGHLYVRQNFKPVFDVPVLIEDDDKPLGSHVFTAMHFEPDDDEVRWLGITLTRGSGRNAAYGKSAKKKKKPTDDVVLTETAPQPSTAEEALSRMVLPDDVRERISRMLTPGSSLAITNDGISRETTPKGTDFIVLMQ